MRDFLISSIFVFIIIMCYLYYVYESFYSEPMTKEKLESIKDTKESLSKKDLLTLSGIKYTFIEKYW